MTNDKPCSDLVELLSDYLDGELVSDTRRDVDAHLSDCPDCQTALDHLQASLVLMRSSTVEQLDPDVRQRLLHEFRRVNG